MNRLICIIRLLSSFGLFGTLINTFVFHVHLCGWLDWIWFIVLCLLGVFSLLDICLTIININDLNNSDIKLHLNLVCLANFFICGSILLKILNNPIDNTILIVLPIVLFLFSAGINRVTMCMLYIIAHIFLICSGLDCQNWHSITLLVVSIILQIVMTINAINERLDNDGVPCLNTILGIVITVATVTYLTIFGTIEYDTTNQKLFILTYILIACSASIQDNISLYALLPSFVMTFSIFYVFEWIPVFSWIILVCVYLCSMLIFALCKHLENQIREVSECIKELEKQIKEKDKKRTLVFPSIPDDFKKGFIREAGRELFRILVDWF